VKKSKTLHLLTCEAILPKSGYHLYQQTTFWCSICLIVKQQNILETLQWICG